MGTYLDQVVATTNSTVNTEDVFIEVRAPAGKEFKLKRVRVFYRGDTTAVGDNNVECRVITVTTATAGAGTAQTPTLKRPTMPAAVSACTVKNGATALALGTGTITTFTNFSFNERGFYEWIPRTDDEVLFSGATGIVEIVVKNSSASRQMAVECEYEE
jgi:hypothetical protein